jgi:hypothetical protein
VVGVREVSIEVTAAQMDDNTQVFEMIPVFKGEVLVDVWLQADDLDAGAGLVLDVGDGVVTDRYIDGSTIGQAGGTHRFADTPGVAPSFAEFPHEYAADDTIDVAVQVAAGTGQAGTLTLIAWIA